MKRTLSTLCLLLLCSFSALASGEIVGTDTTGNTLYAVETLGTQVMTASSGALGTESDGSWSTYAIPLTEIGTTGQYVGNQPSGAAAGKYTVSVYEEASNGTASLTNDTRVGFGSLEWSGASAVTLTAVNTKLGTPAGASVSADIATANTAIGTANAGIAGVPAATASALMAKSIGHSLTFGQLLSGLQAVDLKQAVITNTWNFSTHILDTSYQFVGDGSPTITTHTQYPTSQVLSPAVSGITATVGTVYQP